MTQARAKRRAEPKTVAVTPDLPAPSEHEVARIAAARQRVQARRVPVRVKAEITDGKVAQIGPSHTDGAGWIARMMDAFGTASEAFAISSLNRFIEISRTSGQVDNTSVNAMIAFVEGIRPRDELEGALAVQMAGIHGATMIAMRRLNGAENLQQLEANGTAVNKLARTFAVQVEALAKLRRGGEQKVEVRHVHVHDGGQAIVGTVNQLPAGVGRPTKADACPMQPSTLSHWRLLTTPRCGARTRSGKPCQSPAVRGKARCRMHGGAKGSGQPRGKAHPQYRHGGRTIEAEKYRRLVNELRAWAMADLS